MTDATTEFVAIDVKGQIDAALARRLASEGPITEIAHIILVLTAGVLARPYAPANQIVVWLSFVIGAAILRAWLRRRAKTSGASPNDVLRSIRLGVCLLGVCWGAGVLLIGEQLPLVPLAFITVIFAGLVSGATASLLADPTSFYLMLTLLLAPLSVTLGLHADGTQGTVGVFIIVLYALTITLFYRRAHAALLEQLQTSKHLELAATAAREAREAQRQLVDIIEATSDHIGITDMNGKIRYINRAGRAMVGIEPDEQISGKAILNLIPRHLHDSQFRDLMANLLSAGAWTGEIAFLHRDGHEIPVSVVAQAHRDTTGRIESVSAIARDITNELNARVAMKTARDAAEQATAAKSAFLANTSHEIRTPLNGILGMVELLLDTELTDSQRRQGELIGESAEALLATINDLLDLSKIEAGQLELENISFDFHHLVHSIVRLLMPRAETKHIELVSDVDPRIPQHVVGDSHRMRQVLTNLIGNAVKFTNSGDVVVSARLERVESDHVRVRIGVKDSGIGIPAENLNSIFEPFRQVDTSTTRLYGGTGLGLSIARRLIQMMGGDLGVTSALGAGTDFFFTLDFLRGDFVATHTGADQRLEGVRALVVDDHPTSRRATAEMLQWGGCVVDTAESANNAMVALRRAAADKASYSLLVTDAQMVGDDGFVLAERVRSDHAIRDTRIMILTTAGNKGDGQRCRELGVSGYMHKPVSRVELLEAATAALREMPESSRVERASLVTRHTIGAARRQLNVLLVEDNRVNQVVASSLLQKRGHTVVIANNGREALDRIFGGADFDVVLMDMQMPVLDGVEATRMLRAQGKTSLRIVALTANVSAEERQRCTDAGMNDYLAKPFKSHQLFAVVEGWASGEQMALEGE